MKGNPMDMFDEMDAMFARLFSRMDREFTDAIDPGYGYHSVAWHDGDDRECGEMEDDGAPPPARAAGEPVAEVHHIGDEVKVIADLPGITEESLRMDLKGNTLIIDAGDADHHYRTSAALPPVNKASMHKTLKNGVLEVTIKTMPDSGTK